MEARIEKKLLKLDDITEHYLDDFIIKNINSNYKYKQNWKK